MRVPLFHERPSFRHSRPGPLDDKRELAVTAPTECDTRSLRALWRRLRPLGVRLAVSSECHGEVQAEAGWPLEPAFLLVETRPEEWDAVVFAGGRGAARVARDPFARELAHRFAKAGKILGALGEGRRVLDAAKLGGIFENDPDALADALAAQLGAPETTAAHAPRPAP